MDLSDGTPPFDDGTSGRRNTTSRERHVVRGPRACSSIADVHAGAPRGLDYGRYTHSWIFGGRLEKQDEAIPPLHERVGRKTSACSSGDHNPGWPTAARLAAVGANCDNNANKLQPPHSSRERTPRRPGTRHSSMSLEAGAAASEWDYDSDPELLCARRRACQARQNLDDAECEMDAAVLARLRKLRQTADSYRADCDVLRANLSEATEKQHTLERLIKQEIETSQALTDRNTTLTNENLVAGAKNNLLVGAAARLERRASRLNGEPHALGECSDDELATLIDDAKRAIARMQQVHGERLKSALLCAVCMDRKKTLLLRPCNHLCLCTQCGEVVQQCPLCRQDIQEVIHAHV